jgi:hypothetical protein
MAMNEFSAQAIFGLMTGEPIVQVDFAGKRVQVSPDDARAMAMNLLECAEAAESDACVVHCLTDLGMKQDDAAKMLVAMRDKRAQLKGESR